MSSFECAPAPAVNIAVVLGGMPKDYQCCYHHDATTAATTTTTTTIIIVVVRVVSVVGVTVFTTMIIVSNMIVINIGSIKLISSINLFETYPIDRLVSRSEST